jgi:hypothetical protein
MVLNPDDSGGGSGGGSSVTNEVSNNTVNVLSSSDFNTKDSGEIPLQCLLFPILILC